MAGFLPGAFPRAPRGRQTVLTCPWGLPRPPATTNRAVSGRGDISGRTGSLMAAAPRDWANRCTRSGTVSSCSPVISTWHGGTWSSSAMPWIENRSLNFADSLYAHLDRITVREGQQVTRGQQVGTIGNNHGMYPPHLHFEIHKDLSIGVNHAQEHATCGATGYPPSSSWPIAVWAEAGAMSRHPPQNSFCPPATTLGSSNALAQKRKKAPPLITARIRERHSGHTGISQHSRSTAIASSRLRKEDGRSVTFHG